MMCPICGRNLFRFVKGKYQGMFFCVRCGGRFDEESKPVKPDPYEVTYG